MVITLKQEKTGDHRTRHGMYGTKLYKSWTGMLQRCNNPNDPQYINYSGRGITVCEEWKKPEIFFSWAFSHGYHEGLTIDRIDNNKGYFPDNCRWITMDAQQRNKRNNRVIEFNGEKHCVAEWAEITGISWRVILYRLDNWPVEKVFTTPVRQRKKSIKEDTTNGFN